MDNLVGLGLVLLFAVLIVAMRLRDRRRKEPVLLREIEVFDELPIRVGHGVEAGQKLHVSLGSAGIDGQDTAATLAGLAGSQPSSSRCQHL